MKHIPVIALIGLSTFLAVEYYNSQKPKWYMFGNEHHAKYIRNLELIPVEDEKVIEKLKGSEEHLFPGVYVTIDPKKEV